MNVIPAIDLKDGKCVRLYQGEFDQQTEYSNDPALVARDFSSMGFSDLHIVDLDGARSGAQGNRQIVRGIIGQTDFLVQLGGGIRDLDTARAWLNTGVSRCVIGSVAVTDPDSVFGWMADLGPANVVLALDVRIGDDQVPQLSTHGWTRSSGLSLWDCIDRYLDCGLLHVLCTDISRDGAMSGPNFDLYARFIDRYPGVALQASGGVRHIEDLARLRDIGAAAAITGRALLDGRISAEEVASFLPGA